MTSATYDEIGTGYATTRRPDPRIASRIMGALGDSTSLVNIGAGTGSYEPRDRSVIAVEPSAVMIRQRPPGPSRVVRGRAEHLPFEDGAFESALAILTVHHWTDPWLGIAEMRRVATKRVVMLTWDQSVFEEFWLIRHYLSTMSEVDRPRALAIEEIVAALGACRVQPVPIPHDCADGFFGAF